MKRKLKTLNRRTLCGIGAVIVALSLIIGGVFAWNDNSQHKSNIVTGGNLTAKEDVVLVEDFERPDDWQQDDELKKEVSVKNTGEGQIYIRLQLKEYMDIAEVKYTYSDEELLIDSSGKFVAGATTADLKAWLNSNNVVYNDSQIKTYKAYGDTTEKFYLATDANTNINGVYGKKLLLDYTEGTPKSLVDGVSRAAYETTDDHQLHPTGECLYTSHLWSGSTFPGGKDTDPNKDPFHKYVEWKLGAPLIKMSDWDGQPTASWILDDTSAEGWVYWGEALKPGDSTTKLLESIKLIKQPDGPFYYSLHVDMQAVDLYRLKSEFTGIPQKIEDSYRGEIGFAITSDTQTVAQNGKINFTTAWNGTAVSLSDVTWSVSKGTVSGVETNTKFNTPGVLTIGSAQPLGTLVVTATYNSPEGEKTQKYVITVK